MGTSIMITGTNAQWGGNLFFGVKDLWIHNSIGDGEKTQGELSFSAPPQPVFVTIGCQHRLFRILRWLRRRGAHTASSGSSLLLRQIQRAAFCFTQRKSPKTEICWGVSG